MSKTRDPFPTTPNKVEFWTKWVEKSAFLAKTLPGGWGGGRRDETKADQKIVIKSRVQCNNYLEWLFHTSICICIFTVHKADTSVLLYRRPPACTVLGRLYKGMSALLVVILCSSENFLGAMNGYGLAMFRGNWDFSFTFGIFLALQEFCTGVVSLDRSPRYSKLLCKRIGFIRYHGTFIFVVVGFACVLCSWVYPEHTHVLLPVQRYVALAHAQAMYLYCVCVVL